MYDVIKKLDSKIDRCYDELEQAKSQDSLEDTCFYEGMIAGLSTALLEVRMIPE